MKSSIFIIMLSVTFLRSGNSQRVELNTNYFVIAKNGLNIRTKASIESKKIAKLNYGDSVEIISLSKQKDKTKIGGVSGYWVKVKSQDYIGFVFDAWLSKLRPLSNFNPDDYNCIYLGLEEYLLKSLGIIDSSEYSNFIDGEQAHHMKIYDLNYGHKYIKHGYWEGTELEIQFKNLRDIEVLNLLRISLKECKLNVSEKSYSLSELNPEWQNLRTKEGISFFRVKKITDTIIIKYMPKE